ncbi:short chain dehydrogenase domain-containing protein [Ditylenchus destructor]|nr:short chain dehydrogenase domain-containing protein [Ditylenchus destructor]
MWNCAFSLDLVSHYKYLAHRIDELWTVIHVYWIGFYYSFYELIFDNLASKSTLEYSWNPEEWQQRSTILRAAKIKDKSAKERSDSEVRSEKLVAVVTGADGTIGSEVSKAADEILAQIPSVDLLICNAGVMLPSRKNVTKNPQLKVNVFAHVLLFNKLKDCMARSKVESPRAIFVSSSTIHAGNPRRWLNGDWNNDNISNSEESGYKAYANSKLLLSLYVKYLANNLRRSNSPIRVCSLHPGVVPGRLYANVFAPFRLFINGILSRILRPSRVAACHILGLLLDDRMLSGEYYENGRRVSIDEYRSDGLDHLGAAVDEQLFSFDS